MAYKTGRVYPNISDRWLSHIIFRTIDGDIVYKIFIFHSQPYLAEINLSLEKGFLNKLWCHDQNIYLIGNEHDDDIE